MSNKSIICPTVTAFDLHEYRAQIETIESFAQRIHIDLMDGKFAPTLSPGLNEIWLPDGLECDIHIMYEHVNEWLSRIIELKPSMVVVHAEAQGGNDLPLFAASLREAGIKTGIALLPETSVESVAHLLPHVQHVLVFSGNLGHHGGVADLALLSKVAELKHINNELEIGWDGGINDQNAKLLVEAGVKVLNVGGFIQKSDDPEASYNKILKSL